MTAGSPTLTQALARLDAVAAERGLAMRSDAPLAPITTLRVGGPADRLLEAATRNELLTALAMARESGVPWMVLGNGSDVVVSDPGVRGLVIRNRSRAITLSEAHAEADSGTPMALLVKRATGAGLTGLEWGIAVPGTVGGAAWANAGAHGGEMGDCVVGVDAWDPVTGDQLHLLNAECAFAYRESRFKHESLVVIGATLALRSAPASEVAARVEAFQAQRVATQPLAEQNAGSVFRNPPGDYAGRLIEAAGLKGAREGSASVSERHANFIVSEREGSAADVRTLAERVQATVLASAGVALEFEIEFIGEWGTP
jgi:UDP-N-acetylmuramate dehydrogenase